MNKLDYQLESGRLHATLPKYKRVLAFARAGIAAMQQTAPNAYLSLSFGKQSIVLAHMLYQERPDIPMYFLASSESWFMHNFGEVIDTFVRRWPVRLTIVQTNRLGLDISEPILWLCDRQPGINWEFRGWDEPANSWEEARSAGNRDLQEMCRPDEWDGWYWGLAKDEAYGRRMTLSRRWPGQPHPTIFRYKNGRFRCCPIMNWKMIDLAAYIATHNLPLLNEYHEHGLEARTTARMTGMSAHLGGAAAMRRRNSADFDKLRLRFPELQSYT